MVVMNLTIASPDFKRLVKKLSPVKSDATVIDPVRGAIFASDPDLTVIVESVQLMFADTMELDGPFSVNSSQFSKVVSKTSGETNISLVGNTLVITTKRARYELPTSLPRQKQPLLGLGTYKLAKDALFSVLEFASSASTTDQEQRANFTGGIQITVRNGVLKAVATDHRRLAIAEALVDSKDIDLLCPAILVPAIKSLDADSVYVGESQNELIFQAGNMAIVGRKIVKPFPKYDHLMPAKPAFEAILDAEKVKEGLDDISPMSVADLNNVRNLKMSFTLETLRMSTDDGKAKAEVVLDCQMPDGLNSELTATVDHRALSDFFSMVKGSVTMTGIDGLRPILFTSGNQKLLVTTKRG